jgi:hypothetical protein
MRARLKFIDLNMNMNMDMNNLLYGIGNWLGLPLP